MHTHTIRGKRVWQRRPSAISFPLSHTHIYTGTYRRWRRLMRGKCVRRRRPPQTPRLCLSLSLTHMDTHTHTHTGVGNVIFGGKRARRRRPRRCGAKKRFGKHLPSQSTRLLHFFCDREIGRSNLMAWVCFLWCAVLLIFFCVDRR